MFLLTAAAAALPSLPASLPQDTPTEPVEPKWTGSIDAGGSISTGNTENKSANVGVKAELRREGDRLTLGAFWLYASEEDTAGVNRISDRKLGGHAQYDYFLTEKSYLLATGAAENDKNSNLDLRATVGAGYGYQWREEEEYKLSTEAGLSWFKEDFKSTPTDDYIAARLAWDVEWKPYEKWSVLQGGRIFPSLEDSNDVYTRLETSTRYSATDSLFLQAQWVWDWDNTPAPGDDRSDHRFSVSLGYTF